MACENNLIKHIIETKKIVEGWPEWKKNSLGGSDYKTKTIKVLSYDSFDKNISKKK
ncbi:MULTISPECIES: hypothetical protein [Pantoea]|uniref:hypothetical protein n=1 Tax=Pantoea TaxID=53335 RepID=UPI00190F3363|nr:hypothetical protein [Pantoea sp. 18059]